MGIKEQVLASPSLENNLWMKWRKLLDKKHWEETDESEAIRIQKAFGLVGTPYTAEDHNETAKS